MEYSKSKYRRAYVWHKDNARRRGIEFRFTFDEWVEWWGDDIDNRGPKPWNLQMQRVSDSGAYEAGNVRKGHPKDNSRTASAVRRKRACDAAKAEVERRLDAAMWQESAPPLDDTRMYADEAHVGEAPPVMRLHTNNKLRYRFVK